MRPSTLLLIPAVVLALAACSGDQAVPPEPTTSPASATTAPPSTAAPLPTTTSSSTTMITPLPLEPIPAAFEAGIMPIVQSTCAQCHTGSGPGTQQVRFDTAADVAASSSDIALLVGAGLMPPWPASSVSAPFRHDWSLNGEEIKAVQAWHDGGAVLDVDPATPIVPTSDVISLTAIDMEIVPEAGFDGDRATGDEYRCIVYDPQLTEPTWLLGFEFVPDQADVVHHAIGYRIPEAGRETAEQKDRADDDGGGWTCFGGSGLFDDEIFLGWAPGQGATRFPDGSGLYLEAGDFLVIQIHYHFDVDAPEDKSSLRLDFAEAGEQLAEVYLEPLLAPAEIPCSADEEGPLCDRRTVLTQKIDQYGLRGAPADAILGFCGRTASEFAGMTDGIATSTCDTRIAYDATIISVLGHMHELGKSFRMTLNPGQVDEMILLDIPTWDFDWQFNYELAVDVAIEAGDEIRIECSWDRSLRDPDLEPAYVVWADGTDDEMCFATVASRLES